MVLFGASIKEITNTHGFSSGGFGKGTYMIDQRDFNDNSAYSINHHQHSMNNQAIVVYFLVTSGF